MIDLTAPIQDWMPWAMYPGHRTGMPDVILARWPAEAGSGKAGTCKTWICETPHELREVRKRLAEPIPITNGAADFRRGPDGAVIGPARGMHPRGEVVVALYQPPAEGWPHLVLMSMPVAPPGLERGRYAWEALPDETTALDHMAKLARMVGGRATILRPEVRQ